MNKLTLAFLLLALVMMCHAQQDTTRVNPPKPDSTNQTVEPPPTPPTPTPTTTPEKKRKRPKSYDDYINKGKKPPGSSDFMENVYYGVNLQLGYYSTGYANVLYYDLSPHAGYKFNEFLSAGIQIIYNNQSWSTGSQRVNYSIFGVGGFGRALIMNRFFLQAEYDILSIPLRYVGNSVFTRTTSDEKLFGIGYKSNFTDKLSYYIVLMYDFAPGPNSPYLYNPLVYRAGLAWNF